MSIQRGLVLKAKTAHYPLIIEVNDLGKVDETENMEIIFQSIRQP